MSNIVSVHPSGQMSSLFSLSLFTLPLTPNIVGQVRLPPPHLSQFHGHVRGINVDVNEVKMASYEMNSALPLSCGTHIRSNPFVHAPAEPVPQQKRLADFSALKPANETLDSVNGCV